jgi:transcriptional activator of cad operon
MREGPITTTLRIGDWCVNPASGQISRNGETARLEARTMQLLMCLAGHAGQVVSIDDLLSEVWGEVSVSQDSVYQAVASLRRLLGDDPKQPTYIATVPRLGYRMVAAVSPWPNDPIRDKVTLDQSASRNGASPFSNGADPATAATTSAANSEAPSSRIRTRYLWAAAAALCVAIAATFWTYGKVSGTNPQASAPIPQPPQNSIAVLPFLDLTEGMSNEEFADGMTEELIDKLSKIPGVRVPGATSSFYYKGKQIPIADIAKALGVAFVLDGSVRKSGGRVRIAARLIRADSGYVVWTESYERPFDDIIMVQDDIAGEVTKALKASIQTTTGGATGPR